MNIIIYIICNCHVTKIVILSYTIMRLIYPSCIRVDTPTCDVTTSQDNFNLKTDCNGEPHSRTPGGQPLRTEALCLTWGHSPGLVPAIQTDAFSGILFVIPVAQHHTVAPNHQLPRRPQGHDLASDGVHDLRLPISEPRTKCTKCFGCCCDHDWIPRPPHLTATSLLSSQHPILLFHSSFVLCRFEL